MSKQIQRWRKKSVTPAVIRYELQIIIITRMKKHLTSIVFVFKQQTLSSLQQLPPQTELPTISYDYIADLQPKNKIYVPQHLLLTYAHIPTLTRCLSISQSSRLSRKLVIKVTETPFVIMSRKQLFMNHVSCLMLIIREPHFHLILISALKGFHIHYRSQYLNYHSFITPYIDNRCPNFHLQL